MLIEAAKKSELAPGGMKAVEVNGKEIVLCNFDNKIYALDKRCGHMNAPLDMGSLDGYVLTCPMHHVQFDITTGEALNKPLFHYFGDEEPSDDAQKNEVLDNYSTNIGILMSHIKTCDIRMYPVKIEGDSIKIDI